MEKQPERLSYERFWKIFNEETDQVKAQTYMGEGYALVKQAITPAKRLIANGDPFVLEDMRIGLFTGGEVDVQIGLKPYHLSRGTLIFANRDTMIQVSRLSSDCNVMVVMITQELFRLIMQGDIPSAFDPHVQVWTKALTDEETEVFEGLVSMLLTCSQSMASAHDLVTDQIAAVLHFYQYLYETNDASVKPLGYSREQEIFDRFIYLVNETKGTQRQLAYYADKLCLTQRYVGTVVNHVSGVTAKEWIDRAAIANIKVMLHHSDLQITEIADRMQFSAVSFFCRYFKRLTGMTPLEYKTGQGF